MYWYIRPTDLLNMHGFAAGLGSSSFYKKYLFLVPPGANARCREGFLFSGIEVLPVPYYSWSPLKYNRYLIIERVRAYLAAGDLWQILSHVHDILNRNLLYRLASWLREYYILCPAFYLSSPSPTGSLSGMSPSPCSSMNKSCTFR